INVLMRELCRLHTTRKRLCSLRFKVPSAADVYGEYAQQPQVLAQSLERWLADDASVCSEPLAVASAS
ncbi:lipase family protein, partial [Pseudomonas sp. CCC2.2]|nr:lipase family protein [Pseudomonas sp. CCC2.2]